MHGFQSRDDHGQKLRLIAGHYGIDGDIFHGRRRHPRFKMLDHQIIGTERCPAQHLLHFFFGGGNYRKAITPAPVQERIVHLIEALQEISALKFQDIVLRPPGGNSLDHISRRFGQGPGQSGDNLIDDRVNRLAGLGTIQAGETIRGYGQGWVLESVGLAGCFGVGNKLLLNDRYPWNPQLF